MLLDLGGGGAEPVTVAEAKAWARIDRNDEDALVAALIKAARETIERDAGVALVRRNFRVVLETVPGNRRIASPMRPVGMVTAVTAIGADGVPRSFSVAAAGVRAGPGGFRVTAEVAAAAAGGIEIDFSAGYGTGEVPEALKLAVKQIAAAAYELRGAVAADMQPALVPKAARDLIAPFRERRL